MQQKPKILHSTQSGLPHDPNSSGLLERREAWNGSATADMERLDDTATEMLAADAYSDPRVILFGFSNRDLHDIRLGLRLIGYEAIASCSNLEQLENIPTASMGFTHVLVNIDAFDEVEIAVEALIRFRSTDPDLVILAFSAMVSGDDFGTERRDICDATIKLPVSTARVKSGVAAAEFNHAISDKTHSYETKETQRVIG